jgi:hypothetical protein
VPYASYWRVRFHRKMRVESFGSVSSAPRAMIWRPEEAQVRAFHSGPEVLPCLGPGGHHLARQGARTRAARYQANRYELLAAIEYEAVLRRPPRAAGGRIIVERDPTIGLARNEGDGDVPTHSGDAMTGARAVAQRQRRLRAPARGHQRKGHSEVGDARGELRRETLAHALHFGGALRKRDRLARYPRLVAPDRGGLRRRRCARGQLGFGAGALSHRSDGPRVAFLGHEVFRGRSVHDVGSLDPRHRDGLATALDRRRFPRSCPGAVPGTRKPHRGQRKEERGERDQRQRRAASPRAG